MDCPICYNLIENSCICSCTHHFCYKCILKWCSVGGYNCPICKTKIREIKFDKEFDSLNNPNISLPNTDFTKLITIDFSNVIPGITLINNKGPGVLVKKSLKNGACYTCGIKENDVILSINNISCINHSQSIDIINYYYSNNLLIKFEILIINKIIN